MTTFDPWDHPSLIAAALAGIASPVNPGDFIRPDGSYDVTTENIGERDHVAAVNRKVESVRAERRAQAERELAERLRDATPPRAWHSEPHGEL